MGKLSYALKRARKMDYRAMFKTADMLHKKTGKSRVWLMADMAKCAAKYNAGYVDYKITEMYRLNDAQRATQITRGISNSIVARMNDKRFWHFFDNKTEFNQLSTLPMRRNHSSPSLCRGAATSSASRSTVRAGRASASVRRRITRM